MDWSKYNNSYENITGEKLVIDKIVKSKGINDLTNYKIITRDNIDDLKIGCHIKYIKNIFDINTDKIYEKIYNGGFLVEIIDGNIMHNLTLVLKSNITWKMKFIKYKVYAKFKNNFHYENKDKQFQDNFRNENINEINNRKKEIDKMVQSKLNKLKYNKHYVLFKDDVDFTNFDNSNFDNSK